MTVPFSGGCHCGAVRYECSAEPINVAHCFCTDCQKLTGTQMSTNLLVPKTAFKVTQGKAASYTNKGESGMNVNRFFCSTCGSPLWGEPEVIPDLAVLKAGSLDDSSWIEMKASIFTDSAPDWGHIPEGIPSFGRMPPG